MIYHAEVFAHQRDCAYPDGIPSQFHFYPVLCSSFFGFDFLSPLFVVHVSILFVREATGGRVFRSERSYGGGKGEGKVQVDFRMADAWENGFRRIGAGCKRV